MAKKKKDAAPPLAFDKKLLTRWKTAGARAVAGQPTNAWRFTSEPGAWEAFAAALDLGTVPPEAVWSLGAEGLDQVPPHHALAVLVTMPSTWAGLWTPYTYVCVMLARALAAEPSALDAARSHRDARTRELTALALAEAAGPESPGVEEALARRVAKEWVDQGMVLSLERVNGAPRRGPTDGTRFDACAGVARRVLGPRAVERLAEAHRERLAEYDRAGEGPSWRQPLYASEDPLVLASSALRPAELCAFPLRFSLLSLLSQRWSTEDLFEAAAEVERCARASWERTVSALGLLALARDGGVAPRVEPLLRCLDDNAVSLPPVHDTLAWLLGTDPAWQLRFARSLLQRPASASGSEGPLALVLLAILEPEAAERVAQERGDAVDCARLRGLRPELFTRALERAGPLARPRIVSGILASYGWAEPEVAARAPESLDAEVHFDGSWRDGFLAPYLLALPRPRAEAILRREEDAGRGDLARRALRINPRGESFLAAYEEPR